MIRNKEIIIFFMLFFFIIPQETNAQKHFSIETINGITVVSNPKKPIPKNGLKKRIILNEELSIGEIEGDENYMFGAIILFNADDEGNFYVSDFDNKRIQKYDPKGKYLLTIGRVGQGPGEFESLSHVQFDREDNLYVLDRISRRVSFFDKNGPYLRQIATPNGFEYLYKNSKGLIVGQQIDKHEEGGIINYVMKFGLFDENFNIVVTFQTYESKVSFPSYSDESSMAKMWADIFSQRAFKPQQTFALDKDLIYFGFPDKYVINIFSAKGKLIKKIRRDFDPIPVTKKDKVIYEKNEQERSNILQRFPEHMRKKIFSLIKYPKYKPAYQKITVMENGWLFVVVDSLENEYALIDLFNKEGRYIAQFKTTVPTNNLFFKNGKAYAVAYENEFPFVKRYAIELQEYKNGKWVKSNIK